MADAEREPGKKTPVGKFMARKRREKGLSQAEIARRMYSLGWLTRQGSGRVAQTTVSAWERSWNLENKTLIFWNDYADAMELDDKERAEMLVLAAETQRQGQRMKMAREEG